MSALKAFPVHLALTACLLLMGPSAHACMGLENVNYKMFPDYCRVRCNPTGPGDDAKRKRWESALGKDRRNGPAFLHVHHYCAGLMYQQRALLTSDSKQRSYELERSRANYNYVLKEWRPDAPLYPEAQVRMGKTLEAAGKDGEAVQQYVAATKTRPNYAPAYAAYSDWLAKHGKKAEAIQVLKAGLSKAPSSNALRSRYMALGGKR